MNRADTRRKNLLEFLNKRGYATIEELAQQFSVTPQTMRRDINQLADSGQVQRFHGGVGMPLGSENIIYDQRKLLFTEEKRRIAELVAQHIPDGASLCINIGTTTEAVAYALLEKKNLRVLTNNLNVARICAGNPSFEVITPLLSRCQVYVLKPMEDGELRTLLDRALTTDEELKRRNVEVRETEALFRFSGGDARKLLNILDIIAGASDGDIVIDDESVTECLQQNIALYDKSGEQHYDVISAFIKSVRGSDPNAAIYYLARMLAGGEEPRFIARRLVILASEDVGLANPNALLLANACFDTVHKIGMPEARITLAETTIYLATSPKSNSAYAAINKALQMVEHDTTNRPVPLHLRNAPTKLMDKLGYGADYKYAHDYAGNFVQQEFLPESLSGTRFYTPNEQNAQEAKIAERMRALWGDKYGK